MTGPAEAAVRHILTSPLVAARTAPYLRDGEVDWDGLLREAETMSGGEAVLVRIAYDLWSAQGVVGVWELPRRLGRRQLGRVLEALWISRGEEPPAERVLDAA